IVGNLLDFARQRPPERHPTRLSVLVGNVLELQSYNLLAGRVQVVVDVPDDLPPIELDRAQMQQVLLNLTLNGIQSIRATGRPGTMHVSAWSTGDVDGERVRLAVTDDGPGVPPGLRERLFLPFFTTKDPGEGTGLGLSVSFGIVAAHGGRLWYEAPPERGARFVMELPVEAGRTLPASPDRHGAAVAGGGQDGLVPGAGPESGRPWPPGRVPRVLILDDEPSIRAFLAKALRMAGWQPILATDGRQAVDTASGGQIDALLVDHRMAGMSGTEVYEAITGLRPELSDRFIFMSGDVLNPELRTFAEQRRLGLLGKPFDIDAVQRTVRELLDRRGPLND
ncbi:MAG TPA: ATP-binding protein, partial [Candidatus Limnocylindrales bacterium]